MNIFDIFRKRKPIPEPWAKYYTDEEKDIKVPNISIYTQLLRTAKKHPKLIAYEYFGRKVTYQKFISQIDKASIFIEKQLHKSMKNKEIKTL